MTVEALVGSGDRIAVAAAPFVVVGVVLNVAFPSVFDVGGPSDPLRTLSLIVLVPGVVLWLWAVVLVLTRVPRGELITDGPYALMKHPIYTSVALLVLPSAGFLLDTWVGVVIGIALYVASRTYGRDEEAELEATFGDRWTTYRDGVMLPWL